MGFHKRLVNPNLAIKADGGPFTFLKNRVGQSSHTQCFYSRLRSYTQRQPVFWPNLRHKTFERKEIDLFVWFRLAPFLGFLWREALPGLLKLCLKLCNGKEV
jgi:hypothetical protein